MKRRTTCPDRRGRGVRTRGRTTPPFRGCPSGSPSPSSTAVAAQKPAQPAPVVSGATVLRLTALPGQTREQTLADGAVAGLIPNVIATAQYLAPTYGALGLTECLAALHATAGRVQGGDLSHAEAMLQAQSVALNAVFTSLAKRSAESDYMDHVERFLRLALKAQSQCRANIETLALLKNPPSAVFAKQANIAHGPQQVNNGPASTSRTRESETGQSRLLQRARRWRTAGLRHGGHGRRRRSGCGSRGWLLPARGPLRERLG